MADAAECALSGSAPCRLLVPASPRPVNAPRHTPLRLRAPKQHLIAWIPIHLWRTLGIHRLKLEIAQTQRHENLEFKHAELAADAVARAALKRPPGAGRDGRERRRVGQEALGHEGQRLGEVARVAAQHPAVGPDDPVVRRVAGAGLGIRDPDGRVADANGVGGREEPQRFLHDGVVVGHFVEDVGVIADEAGGGWQV